MRSHLEKYIFEKKRIANVKVFLKEISRVGKIKRFDENLLKTLDAHNLNKKYI